MTRSPIAAGDLHLALDGDKLRGRFALVRRGTDGREQWLLIKKRDDDAVTGWDPEAHPRSVKSGRTNDEVRDAPAASWSGQASWAGPTTDELVALDGLGRSGTWSLGGRELHLTHLDAVVLPGRGRGRPLTRRDLVRHHAVMAPVVLPYLADRPVEVHGARAARTVPAEPCCRCRPMPRIGCDAGATATRARATGASSSCPTPPPRSPSSAGWAPSSCARGSPRSTIRTRRPGPCSTSSPAGAMARRPRSSSPACTAPRWTTSASWVGPCSRVPGASRSGCRWPAARRSRRTRQWVDTVSRAIGASVPDLVDQGSGGARRGRHAHLDGADAGLRRLVTPFGPRHAPGAPVAVPISWDELDDERLRADRWTIRTIGDRVRRVGDPLAPLIGTQQRLPAL